MKITLSLVLLFSLTLSLKGQVTTKKEAKEHRKDIEESAKYKSVIVSFDTIYNKGVPYAIYLKKKNLVYNGSDYTIENLQGKELIFFIRQLVEVDPVDYFWTLNKPYYQVVFAGMPDKNCEIEADILSNLYKSIVSEKLITGNELDTISVKRFVAEYGKHFTKKQDKIDKIWGTPDDKDKDQQNNTDPDPYGLVQRDANTTIGITGANIYQGDKLIGTYSESSSTDNNTVYKMLTFKTLTGTKVPEATAVGTISHDWKVNTTKDDQTYSITSSLGMDAHDIATYLVDNGYL